MFDHTTNEDLVKEVILGNTIAFNELSNRYKKLIYSYLLRSVKSKQDAEDLGQDVFLALYKQIDKFDPKKAKLKTFLLGITVKKILHHLRNKEQSSKRFVNEFEYQHLADPRNFSNELEFKELTSIFTEELNKLSTKDNQIINLRLEGFSFEEIADITGSTHSAVKTRSCRALNFLKERLSELGHKLF